MYNHIKEIYVYEFKYSWHFLIRKKYFFIAVGLLCRCRWPFQNERNVVNDMGITNTLVDLIVVKWMTIFFCFGCKMTNYLKIIFHFWIMGFFLCYGKKSSLLFKIFKDIEAFIYDYVKGLGVIKYFFSTWFLLRKS